MTLFRRTACAVMHTAVIAMFVCGCASTTPETAGTDPVRKLENQKKQGELREMEEAVLIDNDGKPVQSGTSK